MGCAIRINLNSSGICLNSYFLNSEMQIHSDMCDLDLELARPPKKSQVGLICCPEYVCVSRGCKASPRLPEHLRMHALLPHSSERPGWTAGASYPFVTAGELHTHMGEPRMQGIGRRREAEMVPFCLPCAHRLHMCNDISSFTF